MVGNGSSVSSNKSTPVFFQPGDEQTLDLVRQWIYAHTGLYYPTDKLPLLAQRLKAVCRELRIPDLSTLYQFLKDGNRPDLALELAQAVSTNHTYFFRELENIKFFQQRIIPTLPSVERWRIWSGACASGEEVYTLAIVLAETLGMDWARRKGAILGTDISPAMIELAERGVYHYHKLQPIPEALRQKYFRPVGLGQWQVKPELQEWCVFRRLNLVSNPWPFKNRFHVVLLRNVLYYFDNEVRREVVERAYDTTAPGGWLVTSVTESLRNINTRWTWVRPGIYRKSGGK